MTDCLQPCEGLPLSEVFDHQAGRFQQRPVQHSSMTCDGNGRDISNHFNPLRGIQRTLVWCGVYLRSFCLSFRHCRGWMAPQRVSACPCQVVCLGPKTYHLHPWHARRTHFHSFPICLLRLTRAWKLPEAMLSLTPLAICEYKPRRRILPFEPNKLTWLFPWPLCSLRWLSASIPRWLLLARLVGCLRDCRLPSVDG